MLLDFLGSDQDVNIRQTAARLLTQAQLDNSQLLILAERYIPSTDIFLLPVLLENFEDSDNEAVGTALVNALTSTNQLDNVSPTRLEKILQRFPNAVRTSARPLMERIRQQQSSRLAVLEDLERRLVAGDVGEGRRLFFGKALCSTCHAVAGNGGKFGPDLTNIGEIRSTHDILEAIVYPAASLAREYETSRVRTKEVTHAGIIKEQLQEALVIETGPGVMVRIPRRDVLAIESENISMMPPGLDKQLSLQELSDLMAYLTTLPDGMGHLRSQR
jgi:putative heme-binding domain-containing protein